MLPQPKIILFDDKPEELEVLTRALSYLNICALPKEYTGPECLNSLDELTGIRIIFTDIGLQSAAPTGGNNNSVIIAGMLQKAIKKENGPFILISWTNKPEEHAAIIDYIIRYASKLEIPWIIPTANFSLSKQEFQADADKLKQKIEEIYAAFPEFQALLAWENNITNAASSILAKLFELVSPISDFNLVRKRLSELLHSISAKTYGKGNLEAANFLAAYNEAMFPILKDALHQIATNSGLIETWKQLFNSSNIIDLPKETAAELNSFSHFGSLNIQDPFIPGTISKVNEKISKRYLGIQQEEIIRDLLKTPSGKLTAEQITLVTSNSTLVLAEISPSCDYAQKNPGSQTFVLGIIVKNSTNLDLVSRKNDFLWLQLMSKGESISIFFDCRHTFSANLKKATKFKKYLEPIHRLREDALEKLRIDYTRHFMRYGIINFSDK